VKSRYLSGTDLSKALGFPWWVEAALSHDGVAYPLHAGLGRVLNMVEAPPEIAGMEWLKAAAHARSERALRRVVHGLETSRRRAGGQPDFEHRVAAALVHRVTCTGSDITMRQKQIVALTRAGLAIPDAEAQSGTGSGGLACLLHGAGGCPSATPGR
jgi:hypothetical protein